MIVEAGTMEVRPGAQDAARRELDPALHKESGSFLSTHLLRELIAADARSEAAGDPLADRAEALLAAVLAGLELSEGAIIQVEPAGLSGVCLAARGIPDHARELLEARLSHLESLGGSLVRRALTEHRVLLLDRATRDPLMPALRDGNPDIEYAAVVPLLDQGVPVGAVLLAARGGRLSPALLRSLAVGFRLLGLLLAPGRGRQQVAPRLEDPGAGASDNERYLFEIEELTSRLGEAREVARQMEERASSADAALRAEVESSRARNAELEAQLALLSRSGDRERELEGLCAEKTRIIEEHEQRAAELEHELSVLNERLEMLPDGAQVIVSDGASAWQESSFPNDEHSVGEEESESEPVPETTLDLSENVDEQLGEIAAAAAAALEEGNGLDVDADDAEDLDAGLATLDQEIDLGDAADDADANEPIELVVELVVADPGHAQAILHLDSRPGAQAVARESADEAGAAYWCGDGEIPRAKNPIVAVNLLDDSIARFAESDASIWSSARWIVYGADAESGLGFELGSCVLLRRPIDPHCCLEQIQRKAGRKVNGLLLVSAQLREVAGLRHALQEVDAAGSVACDTRQALDLLEIVRRPDAVLIDLALPQGQGLAFAAQLRRQPETSDLPLLLLLPAAMDPLLLRAEAEKAQLLGPFSDEDVHRLVRATLAGRA